MKKIVIGEYVTDGTSVWLEVQRYYGFKKKQAKQMFKDYLKEHGLEFA